MSEPAPALMVLPSIRNSYSSSSTQKDSSSRCWTWGGTPPPGCVVTSKSEYAPPVCSLVVLCVTSSPKTHSERPSPGGTCVTPVSTPSSLLISAQTSKLQSPAVLCNQGERAS